MKLILISIVFAFANKSTAQKSDSAVFYFNKGITEKNENRFLSASKYFEKAIAFNPKFTDAFIQNAYANIEMHRTDAAMVNFTKAYELDAKNKIVMSQLMNLFYNYNMYDKAMDMAHNCIDCDNTKKILALCYFKKEDFASAQRALLALIPMYPKDAEINYSLGRTYLEMEQEKNAIIYYQKAIEIDSTKNNWLHELGLLYYTTNDFKNAVIYFNKAAAKGLPSSQEFNENLGFAYIYSGDFVNGEKILNNLLTKSPSNKDLLRDFAQAYYDKKMYDKCLDYCQKLMELDIKDAQALYQAGMCFQKKGQKDKGQAMCDKAIQLDPLLAKNKHQLQMGGGGL